MTGATLSRATPATACRRPIPINAPTLSRCGWRGGVRGNQGGHLRPASHPGSPLLPARGRPGQPRDLHHHRARGKTLRCPLGVTTCWSLIARYSGYRKVCHPERCRGTSSALAIQQDRSAPAWGAGRQEDPLAAPLGAAWSRSSNRNLRRGKSPRRRRRADTRGTLPVHLPVFHQPGVSGPGHVVARQRCWFHRNGPVFSQERPPALEPWSGRAVVGVDRSSVLPRPDRPGGRSLRRDPVRRREKPLSLAQGEGLG
jgi:hypothetical protein